MKKVTFLIDYEVGDIVYLVTDPEQNKRMVTSIEFTTGEANPIYFLDFADISSKHIAIEMSFDKSTEFL